MLRILLVLEDYSELTFLEAILKKVGFDVDGTQSLAQFEEKRLGLNPEVVIATAQGRKLKAGPVLAQLNGVKMRPRVILLSPQASGPQGLELARQPMVHSVLQSPVQIMELLRSLAEIGQLDPGQLISKYQRVGQTLAAESSERFISGEAFSSADPSASRQERMARAIEESKGSLPQHCSKGAHLEKVKRKILESEPGEEELQQDERRREFVAALYKKTSGIG